MSRGPLVIIGDALLDRDVDGHAARLCPGEPAPVVEDAAVTERPGGAALTALLACLAGAGGSEVVLIAPFGGDEASRAVRRLLPDAVTVVPLPLTGALQEKTRIMAGGRTLLRLDTVPPAPGRPGRRAAAAIAGAGALLVSDYGQGTAASRAIRQALAGRAGRVPLVWDPHPRGAPPVPGTLLATPNEAEAAAAARGGLQSGRGQRNGRGDRNGHGRGHGPDGDGMRGGYHGAFGAAAAAADSLLGRWPARAVAVTLGERGALLAQRGQAPLAIPATPAAKADACGAGDMLAATVATALRDGALLSEAVTRAVSAAAGYVAGGGPGALGAPAATAGIAGTVGTVGTAGIAGTAGTVRGGAAARGSVLVAAGGCFDVLHAGHVSMLKAARALGDTLVVCVNSDASIRRLKGPGRPINPAADRAAVLRALDCVDEVLIFDEDTPERVLSELRPDIWVKGGDYDGRELPEAAVLRRWGGAVITVPYLDGRSTTAIASAAAKAVPPGPR
jgi:D-beta-D-heptose 7-phosphate kinase / D-beta-D-heptose 1-phosphate adenosyltransferase